jgi:hypothetical protein
MFFMIWDLTLLVEEDSQPQWLPLTLMNYCVANEFRLREWALKKGEDVKQKKALRELDHSS